MTDTTWHNPSQRGDSGTRQLLESRQMNWRDSFISRAKRIGVTQKGQIWKKCFTGFISRIMIKKAKIEKKSRSDSRSSGKYPARETNMLRAAATAEQDFKAEKSI
jgi:hypothetical protein